MRVISLNVLFSGEVAIIIIIHDNDNPQAPPAPDASLVREGESLTRIRRRPTIRVTRDEWTTARYGRVLDR